MALENYQIRQIDYSTAMAVIVREHYLHRKAPCSVAFGLFLDDQLKGVVCYGTPSSAPLRSGIAGSEHACNVAELTRLWVCDSVPRNGESFLIGRTVGKAGKEIVVSFAEIQQGHVGIVYQATNWIYTGATVSHDHAYIVEGKRVHPISLRDQGITDPKRWAKENGIQTVKPMPKHRYFYACGTKRDRKRILASLNYPIIPEYPKCDQRRYDDGEKIEMPVMAGLFA